MVYDPSPSFGKIPFKKREKNQQLSSHGLDHGSLCVCCSETFKTKSWVHWPSKKIKHGQIMANLLSKVGLVFVGMLKGSAGDGAAVAGGVQVCTRVQGRFLPQQRESVASIANPHFWLVLGSSCSLHPLVAILVPLGRLKENEFVCLWCI